MGFQEVAQNFVSANPEGVVLNKENDIENADGGDGICWIS